MTTSAAVPPAAAGRSYFTDTFENMHELFGAGQGAEGEAGAPLRFPRCRGSEDIDLPLPADRAPDSPSRLLHLAYGLAHLELGASSRWRLHRTAPSARCLYPTELYIWVDEDSAALRSGLYFYDAAHHRLVRLRGLECRGAVYGALLRSLSARWIVFVTSIWGKTAFRYRDYSYRLCCQEAGMVVGSLLAGAEATGSRAVVCTEFLDDQVSDLLWLAPDQAGALAAVVIDENGAALCDDDARRRPLSAPSWTPSVGGAPGRWPRVTTIDRAARWTTRADVLRSRGAVHAGWDDGNVDRTPGAVLGTERLAAAMLARQSGPPNLLPAPVPLPFPLVTQLGAVLTSSWPTDRGWIRLAEDLRAHLVVGTASGSGTIRAGIHRVTTDGILQQSPGVGRELQGAVRSLNINPCTSPAVCYLSADCEAYLSRHGSRGYRLVHLDLGVLAQRASIVAAAQRWWARPSNGYTTPSVAQLLRLPQDWRPVFQMFLGPHRPDARYRFPLWT